MAVPPDESVRRSGRATKGQHHKKDEELEPPTPKRGKGSKKKQASAEATPPAEDDEDALIRCICGVIEDDDDAERTMICCDRCTAWQHNDCMEITENPDELPEQYFCEQCKPEDHQGLLAKIARGEKPWEEKARQREAEAAERKARRRKGKKGRRGRPSEVKAESAKGVNGDTAAIEPTASPIKNTPTAVTPQPARVATQTPTKPSTAPHPPPAKLAAPIPAPDTTQPRPTPEMPLKTKSTSETGHKRKLRVETPSSESKNAEPEPAQKVRKISPPAENKTPNHRRKSSSAPMPQEDGTSKEGGAQMGLVESTAELQNPTRKRSAEALVKLFVDQTKQAKKQGTYAPSPNKSVDDVGLQLGLLVEYALYMNYWDPAAAPREQYGLVLRQILHNVKANSALRDRLLVGDLSADELSKMSSEDMASKELKEKTAEMKKMTEKQHLLVKDEGPRIRRTHKGEELIDDGSTQALPSQPVYTNPVAPRRRDTDAEEAMTKRNISPVPLSPTDMDPVELPADLSTSGLVASPTSARPPVDAKPPRPAGQNERKSSTFDIQNVWSSVDSPSEAHNRNARAFPPPVVPAAPAIHQIPQSAPQYRPKTALHLQTDADIDKLLKDEEPEPEDEEPYSPSDNPNIPDSEAPTSDIWQGTVSMPSVGTFAGTARWTAGANLGVYAHLPWTDVLPPNLLIEGRIATDKADLYLCGLEYSKTTDLAIVAIKPASDNDRRDFDKLFNYFTSRGRYGVVTKPRDVPRLRDVYLVPLEAGSGGRPEFLDLLDECHLEQVRPERLLLIAIVSKVYEAPGSITATPKQPEAGMGQGSPVSAVQQRQSISMLPGQQMSPVAPHFPQGTPMQGVVHNGSPAQVQGATFSPPPSYQQAMSQYGGYATPQHVPPASMGLQGLEAARIVLGEWIQCPTVNRLLDAAPGTGVTEWTIVREAFESDVVSRSDFTVLMEFLKRRGDEIAARQANGQ